MDGALALRLDDVGAASKLHEVYGITRIRLGPVALPFPGNLLFLKYLPPIKRWAPYPELTGAQWEQILTTLSRAEAKLTVAVTAGWVDRDGGITPFPAKFPEAARVLREGVERGLVEIANHGYTHCLLDDALFRPRLFSGNRPYHREFYDWLPESVHREHLARAQDILGSWFAEPIETLVPPGNVFSPKTVEAAVAVGIRFLSCAGGAPTAGIHGITVVDESRIVPFHDRDIVMGGVDYLARQIESRRDARLLTVRELGRLQVASR